MLIIHRMMIEDIMGMRHLIISHILLTKINPTMVSPLNRLCRTLIIKFPCIALMNFKTPQRKVKFCLVWRDSGPIYYL